MQTREKFEQARGRNLKQKFNNKSHRVRKRQRGKRKKIREKN